MKYPYCLYNDNIRHGPLFKVEGSPFFIDLSSANIALSAEDMRNQKFFQLYLDNAMGSKHSWGLSGYLENRESLLQGCSQMVREKRFYHLGLDIIVPVGTELRTPLNGIVHEVGYEEGEGNYGGFILLRHQGDEFQTFYSLYGHLNPASLPKKNSVLTTGDVFGRIGDFHENGNWFHHTHLQIITQKGLEMEYVSKGYCSEIDLVNMHELCPNPLPFFVV